MKKIIASILVLSMTLMGCAEAPGFQPGLYAGSATYASGDFSMTWNFEIDFKENGTFAMVDDSGAEKGVGTYENNTMTFSDDRTATFEVQADGSLSLTTDLPYGQAAISPDKVDSITLTPVDGQTSATQ